MDMLNKIYTSFKKTELALINNASGAANEFLDELEFYDEGYMQTKISRIQKEIEDITSKISNEIEYKNSSVESETVDELVSRREQLIFYLVFLASNSYNNLDACFNVMDGYYLDFMKCVQAISLYKEGRKKDAYTLLVEYLQEYSNFENHFLANKVFGLLLVELKDYSNAIKFLQYALEFIPNDKECIEQLRICYRHENNVKAASVMDEISQLLDKGTKQ